MAFDTILIANRGEIACRIMRTARARGLRCIAVYTDADAGAPHVVMADLAIRIGAGPAGESYLSIERILQAAKDAGAQAVHPGYGFLSERPDFARACAEAGLTFIGPSADAIESMGNKAGARRVMDRAGVPCVSGYDGADQTDMRLQDEAEKIGFPVMIKAALGGGGKGMRVVPDSAGFADALALARSEAANAFGSDEVILERAVINPRHVEIQVFADTHGNVIHLGERDCSVQRRHQKVLEEAPCPVMSEDLRARMGAAAITAAQAVGYVGAGTVEFLLEESGAFYFLEMNTRLQVEHPVTEMVTGLDLVALQLDVAAGLALPLSQSEVTLTGHAIEARLYAEDPAHGFLPSTGPIVKWSAPVGDGLRVDAGIVERQEVSPYYDPMLAKVIAHGATREQALDRLQGALADLVLYGPVTNRDFLGELLGLAAMRDGQATTGLIAAEYGDAGPQAHGDVALAAAVLFDALQSRATARAGGVADELVGWSSSGALASRLKLSLAGGEVQQVTVRLNRDGGLEVNGARFSRESGWRRDGIRVDLRDVHLDGDTLYVMTGRHSFSVTRLREGAESEGAGDGTVLAPMHGQLLEVFVAEGDRVSAGDRLAVLEAMKMQHEILAETGGVVARVPGGVPGQVRAGDILFEVEDKG
ncbi:MAG: 3-methylcrotonyl-CoA carboxylase [Rhodobacterales bacterium]|nr:MAG: 3-methylcrotonyl-CoA carboxylase [Rhodobacterales bacterium]